MLAAVLGLGIGGHTLTRAQGTMPPPSVHYNPSGGPPMHSGGPVSPAQHQPPTYTYVQTEASGRPLPSGTIMSSTPVAAGGGNPAAHPPRPGMPSGMPTGMPTGMPNRTRMPSGQPGPNPGTILRGPMQGPPGSSDLFTTDFHPGPGPIPTELNKYAHPPYTIAAPDILIIDAIRLIPRPPYRIEPLEILYIKVTGTLREGEIDRQFMVSPEGVVTLDSYGSVRVGGLTLEQAQMAIQSHLSKALKQPQVTLALVQFRGLQQIRGEHLVRADGTISLGAYGSVFVAGMTIGQAKTVIEQYLSQHLLNPTISLDVFAYNSKKYYVILDGGGFGQQVFALPATGNETVLDAISLVQGLAPVSSKRRIWVARPAPAGHGCAQVLPVDWRAITEGGVTTTNYQLFPGDRVFVSANRLIALDNWLSMVLAPVERVLGITLLGSSTVNSIRNNGNGTGTIIVP